MTDYTKLVAALRHCARDIHNCQSGCKYAEKGSMYCHGFLQLDAAAAIEALQAEVERLKDCNEELREKQTYIDHYGDKWMTSAKDVPTSAYEHGYADGRDEAEAQMPKLGEWKTTRPDAPMFGFYYCSICGRKRTSPQDNYCPNCGAKMEVQE